MRASVRLHRWLLVGLLVLLPLAGRAADTLAVYLVSPTPGGRSICELRFALSHPLPPRAEFRIRFPAGFDLSEVQVVGSERIDGGFTLRRTGQEVVVRRSGRGHTVGAGQEVDLKIANVRPPRGQATGDVVRVEVLPVAGARVTLDGVTKWRAPRARTVR